MKSKKLVTIIMCLAIVALLAGNGCAQRGVQPTSTSSMTQEGTKLTVKGKIEYMKNLGGYFILGEVPAREYIIMNENPKVLEGLFKGGKIVVIEGRIVQGAEYLFIDKIDGQPYAGKEPSVSK